MPGGRAPAETTSALEVNSRGLRRPEAVPGWTHSSLPGCPRTRQLLLESDHILQAREGPRPHLCARPHLEEVPSVALEAMYLSTEDVSWGQGEARKVRLGGWLSAGCRDSLENGTEKVRSPTPRTNLSHTLATNPATGVVGKGERWGSPCWTAWGVLTVRGEQGPLVLGLGVVVAVQDQILHDLSVGLRGGAPVQPNGGRRQGAQAQVRWGR